MIANGITHHNKVIIIDR